MLDYEERVNFANDLNAALEEHAKGNTYQAFRRLAVLLAYITDVCTDTEHFWAEDVPEEKRSI